MRRIPTGFAHHKRKQESQVLDQAVKSGFMKKDKNWLMRLMQVIIRLAPGRWESFH